ncbi:cyd operon protein YbgT [Sphingomonas melonis TY]|nr:cyd operon protein YbgT [Sphingomonas melonis TY]
MLFVTLVFLPIVLAYTAWAYRVMFGRVTADAVRTNPDFLLRKERPMWYFSWVLGLGLAIGFGILTASGTNSICRTRTTCHRDTDR